VGYKQMLLVVFGIMMFAGGVVEKKVVECCLFGC